MAPLHQLQLLISSFVFLRLFVFAFLFRGVALFFSQNNNNNNNNK